MKHNTLLYYILTLLLTMCYSCTSEEEPVPSPDDDYVDAIISLTSSSPSSYAQIDGEELIKEMNVLAFMKINGEEQYAYQEKTTKVSTDEETGVTTFTIPIKKSKNGEEYRFAFIANANNVLSKMSFSPLSTKDEVYTSLISELPQAEGWQGDDIASGKTPIPMWGEYEKDIVIKDNMEIDNIHMLRALARVDVNVLDTVQKKFQLKEIHVFNAKNKGRIIPDVNNITTETDGSVTATMASIPSGNDLNIKKLSYTCASTTLSEREVYIYEADAVPLSDDQQTTCFVIGGYYKDDTQLTYYRVDLNPDGQMFQPILRNHQYIIHITDVKSKGADTPEEAFEKRSAEMTVKIVTWTDIKSVVTPTPYNFAVTRNLFENIGDGEYHGTFEVMTEYEDGWHSDASKDVKLEPAEGGKGTTTVSFTVNNVADPSEYYITIYSGSLNKRIEIKR